MSIYPYSNKITYNAYCDIKNERYYSSNLFNGLFKLNLQTFEVEFICRFDGYLGTAMNMHNNAFLWDNKIVFTPRIGAQIAIFDPLTRKIEYFAIQDSIMYSADSILIGDDLWVLGYREKDTFAKINLRTKEVWNSKKLGDIVSEYISEYKDIIIYNQPQIWDRKIYAAIWTTNYVLIFDVDSKEFAIREIHNSKLELTTVVATESYLYLAAMNDVNIYRCNHNGNEFEIYTCVSGFEKTSRPIKYCVMTCVGGIVYAFPESDNKVFILDDVNKKIRIFADYSRVVKETDNEISKGWKKILRCDVSDDEIVVTPYRLSALLKIDTVTGECGSECYEYNEDMINNLFKTEYQDEFVKKENKNHIIVESATYTLSDFIKNI